MPSRALTTVTLFLLAAGVATRYQPAAAQAPKKDDKAATKLVIDPKANYECLISTYTIDKRPVPFFNLTVPDGKSLLNDDVREKVRNAKVSLGEFAFAGTGTIEVPADGTYEFDTNIGTVAVNGRNMGFGRKGGSATLKKGTYTLQVSDNNHGQPYLNSSKISIKNKETGEAVPIVNKGTALQAALRQFAKSTEVSGWVPDAHKVEPKAKSKP